ESLAPNPPLPSPPAGAASTPRRGSWGSVGPFAPPRNGRGGAALLGHGFDPPRACLLFCGAIVWPDATPHRFSPPAPRLLFAGRWRLLAERDPHQDHRHQERTGVEGHTAPRAADLGAGAVAPGPGRGRPRRPHRRLQGAPRQG